MDEDTRNPVEVLAEEFVERCRRGESPSIHEYIERHPDHADEIDAVFQAALLVEQFKRSTGWPASPATESRDPMPEIRRLADYRIVREIGRGGMGIVYEAEQEALRRFVAVKVLVPWATDSAERVERFRREAQAAAKLHHTNIVQVYGVGEHDGLHFFVMELVEGQGLDQLCDSSKGGLKPRRAANIAWQVASALAHAHERGVLHRDVKPANLLLDEDGTAWVTDFGLAKVTLDPGGLTEAGDIIGTIRYMPPERLEGLSDARGDVYGLGLVLYEMLTGRAAFADKDRGSLIGAVRSGRLHAIRDLRPGLPEDLATIVEKAIAPRPEDRYPTAGALADDLERYLEDRPIQARPIGPVERTRRWCRRNKTLAALGAVATAAVLFAAVTGWLGYVTTEDALERESEGRARAEVATRRAEANERMMLDALEGIFESLAKKEDGAPPTRGPGGPPGVRRQDNAELLASVLAFYDRFASANQTNPRLRRESARTLLRVGTIRAQAGDLEAATEALGRATASFEAMRADLPEDEESVLDLARALSESARCATDAGRQADAERDAGRAVAELLALGSESRDERRRQGDLAQARCRLAYAQASRGAEAEARATLAEVGPNARAVAPGALGRRDVAGEMALVYRTLAKGATKAGRDADALRDLDAALEALESGGPMPAPPEARAEIQRERAVVLRRLGREEEAAEAEAEASAAERRGPPHAGSPGRGPPPRPGR